ncbi:glycoside hydrolase family 97 protein [Limibacter armeniacum]|uniref:glycoside hydrolase family 97 protein n=1 Tax=Limibacter armeniacum TaxID=466084 RepID=UPI002FE62DF0
MRRILGIVAVICLSFIMSSCTEKHTVLSPNGKLELTVLNRDGKVFYELRKEGKLILSESRLGLLLKDQGDLSENFIIQNTDEFTFRNTWSQPWGEVKNIEEYYNGLTVSLLQKSNEKERQLNITFKLFDDGLGFRYEFPEQENLKKFVITDELTQFNFTHDFNTWWIPAYSDQIDYEELYTETKLSALEKTMHTPVTMESGDSLFVSIHEAALVDYAAMTLKPVEGALSLECDLVPLSTGEKVMTEAPSVSPWRTIQVGNSAGDLITSYLILNLNEPSKIEDTSWISTGKYAGIWWGMHVKTQTWNQGPIHGAKTENVKELIDFAAENNLKGVLVEGWNKGWEKDWSLGRFRFAEPYDDFDIEFLSKYASEKGVSLIGHHETGGNILNYETQLKEAFEFLKKYKIPAVKTGYVANLINQKEFHQSQFAVNHYNYVTAFAAENKIMLDIHEPVKATGLRRTYPNLMTREGARGTEYEAWSEGNPPEHTVILPFTRCLAGPLDYTPGIFDINIKTRSDNKVHTTLAKQLALYVTIYSPWQMAADLPENYTGQPAFQFIRDVPTNWEDTKVLNAKIGDYITVVRKDRDSDDWYLGSVTDEHEREFEISLDFLMPEKKYKAYVYADQEDTDLMNNPTAIEISETEVTSDQKLNISLAAGGGQAIRFKLLN